jgi:large subunit ribosomal protein L23
MIIMTVLLYPLATEKAIGTIDRTNVITYIVDMRATKTEVRAEFEKSFGVKVSGIRAVNLPNNKRKVYIKIAKGYKASDVAAKLKLI